MGRKGKERGDLYGRECMTRVERKEREGRI